MKKFPLALSIVNFVLLAVAIVCNIALAIVAGNDLSFLAQASIVLSVVAALSSLAYLFGGAGKNEAEYYKAFALTFAFSEFFSMLKFLVGDEVKRAIYTVPFISIIFALTLTIGLSKNLGKTMSLVLSYVLVGLSLAEFGVALFTTKFFFSAGATFATAVILLLDTYAKYVDKFNRKLAATEAEKEEPAKEAE